MEKRVSVSFLVAWFPTLKGQFDEEGWIQVVSDSTLEKGELALGDGKLFLHPVIWEMLPEGGLP